MSCVLTTTTIQTKHASMELVREFLVFHDFTNTLESYEAELRTGIGKGFDVDKNLDLIFSLYFPKFHADSLLSLLGFFKHYFSSSSDAPLASMLSKLETSLLRFYVVHAIQCNPNNKVVNFFTLYDAELLQRSAGRGTSSCVFGLKSSSSSHTTHASTCLDCELGL
eukprot:XP_006596883.1 WD repeat-containing protein 91 [Glycine max]